MNIFFSLPDGFTLGGVTTWTAEMSNRLSHNGESVTIAEHKTFNPKISFDICDQVSFVNCTDAEHADSPFIKQKDIKKFASWYSKDDLTVYVPNWSNGTYATCAQLSLSTAKKMRVIGFVHTDEDLYYDWLDFYEPMIHVFVCVSQDIYDKLSRKLPDRISDMVVKPYAVNVLASFKRPYSSSEKPIKLIYAGRISQRQKRIFDLVALIEQLEKLSVQFVFEIIGDGTEYKALESKLSQLPHSIRSKVNLSPSKLPSEMAATWRSADIFISVSQYEGTSIAMLEAMGQGCVPVVTEVSGTKAVIKNNSNGFSRSIGDIEGLAESIQILAEDRQRLESVGKQAYETIQNRYSYDDYLKWFEDLNMSIWQKPDRIWPENKPVIRPKLAAIKKEDILGLFKADPASTRIILHKLLHFSRLSVPFYFLKGVWASITNRTHSNYV